MQQSFKLKGNLFTLSVMEIQTASIDALEEELKVRIKLAPKFFNHSPIVIDVSQIRDNEVLDYQALKAMLKAHQLVAVGIRGAQEDSHEAILAANFALFTEANPKHKDQRTVSREIGTRIVSQPVRSGQQIYAEGDLVVLASVGFGAELLAAGNIHIYGTLRGRALAGVNGNQKARIFCQDLDAELIAIAGYYQLFDQDKDRVTGDVQVLLEGDKLLIQALR